MQAFEFNRPGTILDLMEILSLSGARILAGGTDNIPRMRHSKYPGSILVDTRHLVIHEGLND